MALLEKTEELPAVCRSYFKRMSEKRKDNLGKNSRNSIYGAERKMR